MVPFLALLTLGQATIASDPALAKPVTLQGSYLTVPEVLQELSRQTGSKIKPALGVEPLKLNLWLEKQPAHRAMGWVASVLGLKWVQAGNGWLLSSSSTEVSERESFIEAEDALLVQHVKEQVRALVRLTESYAFGATPDAQLGLPEPENWAREKAREQGWYAAGVQHRTNGSWLRNFCGGYYTRMATGSPLNWPYSFTIEAPLDPLGASLGYCAIDAGSQELEGLTIASYADGSYGELLVGVMNGPKVKPQKTRRVLRYLRPAPSLAKSGYATSLAQWEANGQGLPEDLDLRTPEEMPNPYPNGCFGLGEQVQVFGKGYKLPVVSDAFRAPLLRDGLATQGKLAEAVKGLRETEGLYARFEDGALLLRHGGFWRLRLTEPPEGAVRKLEKAAEIGSPSIDDYADLAYDWLLMRDVRCDNRFRSKDTLLIRADVEPLLKYRFGLAYYGMLLPERRRPARTGWIRYPLHGEYGGTIYPLKGYSTTTVDYSSFTLSWRQPKVFRPGSHPSSHVSPFFFGPLQEVSYTGGPRIKAFPFAKSASVGAINFGSYETWRRYALTQTMFEFFSRLTKGKIRNAFVLGCPLLEYLMHTHRLYEENFLIPYIISATGGEVGTLRQPELPSDWRNLPLWLNEDLRHQHLYLHPGMDYLRTPDPGAFLSYAKSTAEGHGLYELKIGNPANWVVYRMYIP